MPGDLIILIPLSGFFATIILTVLLRNKLKFISLCPLASMLGLMVLYLPAKLINEPVALSASPVLLIAGLSCGIGIYLTLTTLMIVFAIKRVKQTHYVNKFTIAAVLCLLVYVSSYMILSRQGMQISEEWDIEGYWVRVPEDTDQWYICHFTYGLFYCVPIGMESTLGTASFNWNAPTMSL